MDDVERAILELLASNPYPPPTANWIARRLAQPVDEVEDALAALRVLRHVSARRVAQPGGIADPAYAITPPVGRPWPRRRAQLVDSSGAGLDLCTATLPGLRPCPCTLFRLVRGQQRGDV